MRTIGSIIRWVLIAGISLFVLMKIEYWVAHPFLILALGSSLYGIATAGRKKGGSAQ